MHILVSNDDGINAPGLATLAEAMLPLGRVTVIAPAENQSATGHKKTLHRPLRINPIQDYMEGVEAYAVNGSPGDCTAVAKLGFIKDPIDIVVSGINRGANLGQDVTYSGTVAVALEAAIFHIPAIAFSLDCREYDADYSLCIDVVRRITQKVMQEGLPDRIILNVNIPYGIPLKGVKSVRQGLREYRDQLIERVDPHGEAYYWIGGERPTGDVSLEGTDIWALNEGYVSLTPIHLDLTAHNFLEEVKAWDTEL